MLHPTRVFLCNIGVNTQGGEAFGQYSVLFTDLLIHLIPKFRQADMLLGIHAREATLPQKLYGNADTGFADAKRFHNIQRAHAACFALQDQDRLQVIFAGSVQPFGGRFSSIFIKLQCLHLERDG